MTSSPKVAVIGGGLAGLSAAIAAAEQGCHVTVLEAGEEIAYPCNTRLAMGFFNVAFADIGAPPARLRAAISAATDGFADPALADALAQQAEPALRWLRALGVRTIVGNWRPGSAAMLAPPAAIGPGLSWPGRGADRMLRQLERSLVGAGGRLERGVRVRKLVMQSGRCIGVSCRQGDADRTFDADAVIIADGGFQADDDLVQHHLGARPGTLVRRNAGTGRGDGLRMALAVGATVTPLDGFYGHVQAAEALTDARLWPYPTCDHLIGAGIAVDGDARRFADEGRGGIHVANRMARLNAPAFAICDHRAWMTRATAFPLPANPLLITAGARIHRADDIAALATHARLPPRQLAETVDAYNAALAAGLAETLTPPRTARLLAPLPIAEAPFYAVPIRGGITYTTGGIAIDADCHVRAAAGGVVVGLYAAGSATGGHEGGPTSGYTGGLAKALVFGRRAGMTAAAETGGRATIMTTRTPRHATYLN